MTIIAKMTAAASIALLTSAGALAASHGGPLDADGDGMLTEEEFAPAANMGMVFAGVDSDGDGMVSEAEYNDAARDAADEDGSGGSLNNDEFTRYDELTRMFSQARADRDAIEFSAIDTDGDGELSDEERMAADSM